MNNYVATAEAVSKFLLANNIDPMKVKRVSLFFEAGLQATVEVEYVELDITGLFEQIDDFVLVKREQ